MSRAAIASGTRRLERNYDVDGLEDACSALVNAASNVDEVVFTIEAGMQPRSTWIDNFDETTERLVTLGGLTEAEAKRKLSIRARGAGFSVK